MSAAAAISRGRDPLVDRAERGLALADEPRDVGIVGRALADRLLEDRGIGGDAGEAILFDQPFKLAIGDDVARQIVEPDGLAFLRKRTQRVHDVFHFAICALAASTTSSAVKPKRFIKSLPGAEAPNRCMPSMAPSAPA